MQTGEEVVYLGRIISKANFRGFVYSVDGQRRLVKSWDEFEVYMATGTWFATQEEAEDKAAKIPKKKVLKKEPSDVLPNQAGE